jgi:hypothetical protein
MLIKNPLQAKRYLNKLVNRSKTIESEINQVRDDPKRKPKYRVTLGSFNRSCAYYRKLVIDRHHHRHHIDWPNFYESIGSEAFLLLKRSDFDGVAARLRKLTKLIVKKHRSYGAQPILRWRHVGLLVKIDQKIARLMSLTKSGKKKVINESIEDTYMDILGYCILGLALVNYERNEES